MGFGGGGKKLLGGRLRNRDQTPLECRSNLVNILLQILCYPRLEWILPLNLEVKTKKIKKGLHRKILGYLITFTRSVLLFQRKKAFVVTCFWVKVCWSSCTSTNVYSRLGGTSSDLGGGTAQTPPPPGIGVARNFWLGGGQTKNDMQWRHQKFSKEELFVGQRYRRMYDLKPWSGLALNEEFSKGRALKPKVKIENM